LELFFRCGAKEEIKLADSEEGKLDGFANAAPLIHELCQSSQEVVTPPIVINRTLARIADQWRSKKLLSA
jgi:hypothetical protein